MRTGVVTFFQSNTNYGQMLQCYALQMVLNKIGHKSFVIRYGFEQKYFHPFKRRYFKPGGLERMKCDFYEARKNIDYRGFDWFLKKHVSFSLLTYNDLCEIRRLPPRADCYVSGSDQVWAQLLNNDNNRTFFLAFGSKKVKRVSYAPSFAMQNYPDNLLDALSSELSRFDAISVREVSGQNICQSAGFYAQLVLDPTLLLSGDHYLALSRTCLHKDFCFVYHVNVDSPDVLHWKEFHAENVHSGLKTIAVWANRIPGINMEFLNGAEYLYPSVEEWLGLINSAKYVLTSSFHGVVFSILFHTPFWVVLRPESQFAGNDRIYTLLKSLGLENRIVSHTTDIKDLSIDWLFVETALECLRTDSISFITNNIVG